MGWQTMEKYLLLLMVLIFIYIYNKEIKKVILSAWLLSCCQLQWFYQKSHDTGILLKVLVLGINYHLITLAFISKENWVSGLHKYRKLKNTVWVHTKGSETVSKRIQTFFFFKLWFKIAVSFAGGWLVILFTL